MNRIAAACFVGSLVFLNACATHSNVAAATPVKVSVTGNDDISAGFARDVRDATLSAIARKAPNAPALTVKVFLDASSSGTTVTPSATEPASRVVRSTNPHPEEDGAPATVPVLPATIGGSFPSAWADVHGSYTITDAQGRMVESQMLRLSVDMRHNEGAFGVRRALMTQAAETIASRVQALSSK